MKACYRVGSSFLLIAALWAPSASAQIAVAVGEGQEVRVSLTGDLEPTKGVLTSSDVGWALTMSDGQSRVLDPRDRPIPMTHGAYGSCRSPGRYCSWRCSSMSSSVKATAFMRLSANNSAWL